MAIFDNIGLNPILNMLIIIVEFIILVGFLVIYFSKKITVLKPLIWSIFFYLLSNIFGIIFLGIVGVLIGDVIIGFLSYIFLGLDVALLVTYLESYERDEPFSQRSIITILLIALTGILQIVNLLCPENLSFIGLLAPLPYTIIGILYFKYVIQISNRARVETQKKKIRKVQYGVFMLFLAPVTILLIFTIILIPLAITNLSLFKDLLIINDQQFNLGSLNLIIIKPIDWSNSN